MPGGSRIPEGHRLRVDIEAGLIQDLATRETYGITPYPTFIRDILIHGGLVPWAKQRKEA